MRRGKLFYIANSVATGFFQMVFYYLKAEKNRALEKNSFWSYIKFYTYIDFKWKLSYLKTKKKPIKSIYKL